MDAGDHDKQAPVQKEEAPPPSGPVPESALDEWAPKARKRRLWRYPLYLVALLLFAEALFLLWVWPDWDALRAGRIPPSALIEDYKSAREADPKLPPLRWTPVQKAFPKSIKNVFVLAEDSRFYEHQGIDFQALEDAISYNYRRGKILLGASTISQQTAKNMFLSLSRNPLRKWHELILTYWLEAELSKAEILHIYLNVAEFGRGVYGLEAAARTYYRVGAHQLSSSQAIELAASLPSPKKNNPKLQTRTFQRRVKRIAQTLRAVDRYAAERKGSSQASVDAAAALQKNLEALRQEMNENPSEPASATPPSAADAPAEDSSVESAEGGESSPPTEGETNPEVPSAGDSAEIQAPLETAPIESAPLEATTPEPNRDELPASAPETVPSEEVPP